MPRAKILWTRNLSISHEDYYSSTDITYLCGPTSEWEEITPEQLDFLEKNIGFLRHPSNNGEYRAVIVVDQGRSLHEYIGEIAAVKTKFDAEHEQAKKRAEGAIRKKAATTRENRRKQFEKLRKEFEG